MEEDDELQLEETAIIASGFSPPRRRPWWISLAAATAVLLILSVVYHRQGSEAWQSSQHVSSKQDTLVRFESNDKSNATNTTEPPEQLRSEYPFLFSHSDTIESDNRNHFIGIPYQCEGPLYNQFTLDLRQYAAEQIQTGARPPLWGQRELPPNCRLLLWGNSHTRQIGLSLVGQHTHVEKVIIYSQDLNKAMARRFDFSHNRSVYVVANTYAAYSTKWRRLLEIQIQKRLIKMDAIIVGTFNTCNAPVNTTFAEEMKQWEEHQFDGEVDCVHQEGPKFAEIASEYEGPMAYSSMFAEYRHKTYDAERESVMEMQKARSHLAYLDARHHVVNMQTECGSPFRESVGDCVNNATAARKYHRCVGPRGGHPDLVAWDFIDYVWQQYE